MATGTHGSPPTWPRPAQAPERRAEALEFQAVNYEADNLVFATIYGGFLVVSLVLAVVCGVYSLMRYFSSP